MTTIEEVVIAAKAGGKVVRDYFGQALQTEQKSNVGDLRTKADTDSERVIVAALRQKFPAYNIYAEESGQIDNGSDHTFIIDPLDGTNNFVLGIPNFTISIGLLRGDETILGVIYNPILDQVYSAEKGKGAFLDGRRIQVNQEADITHATISYTCGYNTSREYSDRLKRKLYDLHIKRLLDSWAPAYDYCLLASGRIETVISKEGDLEDYAAAKIIVTEAGGMITGFKNEAVNGRTSEFIATNNSHIHDKLSSLLN